MLRLALILGIVLLPKVDNLKCYSCLPGSSETCEAKECPAGHHCGVLRVTSYAGGSKLEDMNLKVCVLPEQCVKGSINLGISKTVITSQCCSSELCNTQLAPDASKLHPNGKKCFTCDGQKCTKTLNCEGDEDYCISTKVGAALGMVTMKGCASKLICTSSNMAPESMVGGFGVDLTCCQGDYCNSASSTSAGLLLLVSQLISVVLLS